MPPFQKGGLESLSSVAEQGRRGWDGEQAPCTSALGLRLALVSSLAGSGAHLPTALPDLCAAGWVAGKAERENSWRPGVVVSSHQGKTKD